MSKRWTNGCQPCFTAGRGGPFPPSPAQPRAGNLFLPWPGRALGREEQATRIRTHYTHIQAPIICPSCSSASQPTAPDLNHVDARPVYDIACKGSTHCTLTIFPISAAQSNEHQEQFPIDPAGQGKKEKQKRKNQKRKRRGKRENSAAIVHCKEQLTPLFFPSHLPHLTPRLFTTQPSLPRPTLATYPSSKSTGCTCLWLSASPQPVPGCAHRPTPTAGNCHSTARSFPSPPAPPPPSCPFPLPHALICLFSCHYGRPARYFSRPVALR